MADNRTPESRSALMSRIGSKNTAPEMVVRRLLHRLGYRFRLHKKDLPGKPDVVLPKWSSAVFVHGCFWHGHECNIGKLPKSKLDYWQPKIEKNRIRDEAKCRQLEAAGWRVLTLWQCELKDPAELSLRLKDFIENGQKDDRQEQKTCLNKCRTR